MQTLELAGTCFWVFDGCMFAKETDDGRQHAYQVSAPMPQTQSRRYLVFSGTAPTPCFPTSNAMSQAQAKQTRIELPGQHLTLQETLRVMDVAREMRDQREKAEEMFRRDDLRVALREKLLRTARLSGDNVTEAEIDAAIGQYMETLHTYQDPAPGLKRFLAHCWVWRGRILWSLAGLAGFAGGLWYLFG